LRGPHLHLELRDNICHDWGVNQCRGTGYSATSKPDGWLDPSDFIRGLDIEANGADSVIKVNKGLPPVSVKISLDPRADIDKNVDLWIFAFTPSGNYTYDWNTKAWRQEAGASYQGPLFKLSSYEILNTASSSLLTAKGTYTFDFGYDFNMNGSIDFDQLVADSVKVIVK